MWPIINVSDGPDINLRAGTVGLEGEYQAGREC